MPWFAPFFLRARFLRPRLDITDLLDASQVGVECRTRLGVVGEAVPACGGPLMDQCVLDCADDAACPTGMDCIAVDPGMTIFRCMWPVE